jgi:peptidoglycan/LPS O-acetylase OafA/YrhL
VSSWRGRLKFLAAGGAWIGLCQLVFGYFGMNGNWLTAVRIPGTLAVLIAIIPESTAPVSEPRLDAPQAEFVQGPWQRRISSVAAFAGIGCFIAALVVAIAWGVHWLFWLMFGTTFLSVIALHFTTDREQWGDY